MTPDRFQEIEELYHAAREGTAEQRAALLAQAAPELRREIESLLAQRSGVEFLDRPAIQNAPQLLEDSTLTGLAVGANLGPYRIESKLGEGGMGAVYRATDTRLNRDVAIKVLPGSFAADAGRMARFRREARVLASLNHTNIAAIYDIEEGAIVMELVEGTDLKGPVSVDTAIAYARQMAAGLEAAHERGIIHRDLKPANIKVTHDGVVKLLDFGLATAAEPEEAAYPAVSPTVSPTRSLSMTQTGMIMGTAAYMAPEQARGDKVDKRADIWAFGVVLYEMLTGGRLFAGATTSDTLAAVLKTEPDLSKIPVQLRPVVERCLRKDPRQRWRDIGDVRIALEEVLTDVPDLPAPAPRRSVLPWALAGAGVIVGALALWAPWRRPVEQPLTRLSVDLGPDAMKGPNLTAAISPDGRRLVFPARSPNGKQQLVTRLLEQAQTTVLPGTEEGSDPFFSPDSQWVGFFADGKLKKISVQGGAPITLCDTQRDSGASWGEDGTITAALSLLSPLSRVPAAGGNPQRLTSLDKGDLTHGWPQVLPGGLAAIFTVSPRGSGMEDASIEAMSLSSGVTRTLVKEAYFGRYLPASRGRGYLVYLHQGVLFGVAFDPGRLELQSAPVPLLEDVAANPTDGGGQFDFSMAPSGHGTLVYSAGKQTGQTWPVVWLDSSGKTSPLIATPGLYGEPRFSPDGRRLAVSMSTSSGTNIFSYDLQRETMTQLTFGGHADVPVWTPDGKHLVITSGSDYEIWWMRADGSGQPHRIFESKNTIVPWSFSPDGRRLAYRESHSETGIDIMTLPLDLSDPDHPKAGSPEPFLQSPSEKLVPMFSPDGRWIAYRSNESGRFEIYVQPFPAGRGGKWQVSTGGGLYGIWSDNGRELFYETPDYRIMVVDYKVTGDSFVPGKPRLWSEKQLSYPGNSNLALAPDGKRFAVFPMPEADGLEKGTVHVTFLFNFLDELRRRIPAGR
ncbi:MAG TPA: protein kinase [Bryobacteraceae bacterium]|nr:protein kinase [Bryobacteraceae bacterium]